MTKEVAFLAEWTEGIERRADDRIRTLFQVARVVTDDEEQHLCLIRNISAGGLLLETCTPFEIGTHVRIEPKSCAPVVGSVRWMKSRYAGIAFDERIDVEEYLRARYPDAALTARQPRLVVSNPARLLVGPIWHIIQLCDVSQGGAKVESDLPIEIDESVILQIDGLAPRAARVRWTHDGRVGLEFLRPIPLPELAGWARCTAKESEKETEKETEAA